MLFIIYLNKLFLLEEINKISSFADDTIIFYTSETELYQKPKVNLLDYKKNERNKINKKMEEKKWKKKIFSYL